MRKILLAVVLSLSLLSSALWGATQGAGATQGISFPCWLGLDGTYTINANASAGVLTIGQPDAVTGNFTGTMFSQPLIGHFNCTSHKITLVRLPSLTNLHAVQWYTGDYNAVSFIKLQGTFQTYTSLTAAEPGYPWKAFKG